MKKNALSIRNLSISTEAEPILSNISFDLHEGEILGIVGINGAGKTMLAKVLCGWSEPDAGVLFLDGIKVCLSQRQPSLITDIGYVSENPGMVENLTVAENLFMGANAGVGQFVSRQRLFKKADAVFQDTRFPVDSRANAGTLTCAQKAMVQIARQLLHHPKVLIVDDLAGAFSDDQLENLRRIFVRYTKNGGSLIYMSHNYDDALSLATRLLVIRDQSLVAEFQRDEFDKQQLRNVLYPMGTLTPAIDTGLHQQLFQEGQELLRVEGLQSEALRGVSFALHKGEVMGITGVVGSGKSDVIACLGGLMPQAGGRIYLEGKPLALKTPMDALRKGIAVCLESREEMLLSDHDSIWMNISLGVIDRMRRRVFLSRKREEILAREYCERLGIQDDIHQKLSKLSNAVLLKVSLAKCMAPNPKLLLLDEPNRELDRRGVQELCCTLERIRESCGVVVVFSRIDHLADICDRVLVFHQGELLTEMKKGDITYETMMRLIIEKEMTENV